VQLWWFNIDKLHEVGHILNVYMDELSYFGLAEHPFRIGPDPRFLYFSEQVKEAVAKCEYMAQDRTGPIYIYGPIGSGKTSLLRRLNERLSADERYRVALIISPNIKTSNAFLRLVMESFDVKTERSYDENLRNFQNFLIEEYQQGRVPLLMVDEAQNMNRDMLKLVHYLLNFETATVKLLQVMLVGQEELAAKVLKYRELASRMFPIPMRAMDIDELTEMIRFRWIVSGGDVNSSIPFDSPNNVTYAVIYAYSKGLPRDAIKICGEAMRYMIFQNTNHISPEEIAEVARSLNLKGEE
jgi:general secretion pathway protein A